MGTPAAGAIILFPFPFSDLSKSKLRPAVVLASAGGDDWITCQITSRTFGDPRAVEIADADLIAGSLKIVSYARPSKLFTASRNLIVSEVGMLTSQKLDEIIDGVIKTLRPGSTP